MSWTPRAGALTGGTGGALPPPGSDGTVLTSLGGAWQAQPSAITPMASLPELVVEDGAADYVRILDATDSAEKKILVNNLMSA